MSEQFFNNVNKIQFEGPDSTNPFAFRYYDENQVVNGKKMKEHLRFAACYWHNFCWAGSDIFGQVLLIVLGFKQQVTSYNWLNKKLPLLLNSLKN